MGTWEAYQGGIYLLFSLFSGSWEAVLASFTTVLKVLGSCSSLFLPLFSGSWEAVLASFLLVLPG